MKKATMLVYFIIALQISALSQNLHIEQQFSLNGTDDLNDKATDLFPTSDCGVIVLTSVESFITGVDIKVIRLDMFGNEIWTYEFVTSGDDVPGQLDVDPNGNIYVSGSTDSLSTGGLDILVFSLTSQGSLRWTHIKNNNQATDDICNDLHYTNSNTIFVCGRAENDGFMLVVDANLGTYINSQYQDLISSWSNHYLKISENSANEVLILVRSVSNGFGQTDVYSYNAQIGTFIVTYDWMFPGLASTFPVDFYTEGTDVYVTGYRVYIDDTSLYIASTANMFNFFYLESVSDFKFSKGERIFKNHNNDLIVIGHFDSDTMSINRDEAVRMLRFNSLGSLLNNASLGGADGLDQKLVTAQRSSTTSGDLFVYYTSDSVGRSSRGVLKLSSQFLNPQFIDISINPFGRNYGMQMKLDTYNNIYTCGYYENANLLYDLDFTKLTGYSFSDSLYLGGYNQLNSSYSNAGQYFWFLNNMPFDTTTTNSLLLDQSGDYMCVYSKNCQIDTVTILNVVCQAPIVTSQSNSSSYCEGESTHLFVEALGINPTYQWYFNSQPISGETDSILLLSSINFADSGNYYCIVNGNCGSDTTQYITITVNPLPSIAFMFDNTNLIVDSGFSYLWYFNDTVVSGANSNSFPVIQSGVYSVIATNAFGCSDSIGELVTMSDDNKPDSKLLLFPNPALNNTVHVQSNTYLLEEYEYYILNSSGQRILHGSVNFSVSPKFELNIEELPSGVHQLIFFSDTRRIVQRLVKL